MTLTIKVDVDGVLADLHPEWLSKYNKEYGDTLASWDIKEWSIHNFVKPECGKNVYKYLNDPDLYDNVEPVPNARYAVGWMRDLGFRVVFVTAGIFPAKINWLDKHGFLVHPRYPYDPRPENDMDVVFAADKSLIKGDVEIDDYWENFSSGKVHILMDQPWNRDYIGYAVREHNWIDILNRLAKVKHDEEESVYE